jgi:cobalt-zinc-cadmium efflux system protein
VLLLVSIGAIGVEALQRLAHPGPVDASMVAWVAGAGLLVNGATALLFMRGREGDLNLRSAFAHMASPTRVLSAGVLVSALIIMRTGLDVAGPGAVAGHRGGDRAGTWGLLRESTNLALDAVPDHGSYRRSGVPGRLPGVREVHDLHVWALSTTECAVTVHLVHGSTAQADVLCRAAVTGLKERFSIGHATIQLETEDLAAACTLRSAGVV